MRQNSSYLSQARNRQITKFLRFTKNSKINGCVERQKRAQQAISIGGKNRKIPKKLFRLDKNEKSDNAANFTAIYIPEPNLK